MNEEANETVATAAPSGSVALVPYAVRVNASLVKRGFWPKIRQVAAHIPFAEDAIALFYCAKDPETPFAVKATLFGALAFFVVPKPFRPRRLPIPGLMVLDEAAVIAAAVAMAQRAILPRHRDAARRALNRMAAG
jgi:uncharacterized membrane protein YkvA (DUF1232 family)